jgi:16S rRNA (guanine(966)-N(2))-methyltransferase RsmD
MVDLFSGSGALGIEAYSRGFSKCELVEMNPKAVKVIRENLASLKIENGDCEVIKMDVFQFLKITEKNYDLIIADPPYKLNRYLEMLELISTRHLLKDSGIIVLESENTYELPDSYNDLIKYKEKILGFSKFTLYKKES